MKITAFLMSIVMMFSFFIDNFGALFRGISTAEITVDTSDTGDVIPNIVDNINLWDMGNTFIGAERNGNRRNLLQERADKIIFGNGETGKGIYIHVAVL